MLLTQLWVHLPDVQQCQSTDPDCGEGNCCIYGRVPSSKNGPFMLKRPEFLNGFQEGIFKDRGRELDMVYDQLMHSFLTG